MRRTVPVVRLSAEQLRTCAQIAAARDSSNRRARVVDRKDSRRSGEAVALDGVIGEMALALSLGQPTDHLWDIGPRSAANDVGHDLVLPSGETVDVKTTFSNRADLQVHKHKKVNPASWYALAIRETPIANGSGVDVSIRGFVHHKEVMADRRLKRVPYRMNKEFFVVPQSELVQDLPEKSFLETLD